MVTETLTIPNGEKAYGYMGICKAAKSPLE